MTQIERLEGLDAEAIGAATRAICERRFHDFERMGDLFVHDANVAVAAYLAKRREQGFEEMPRYPTDGMIDAGKMEAWPVAYGDAADPCAVYRAMFDAGSQK
jgi:hypothetical protein